MIGRRHFITLLGGAAAWPLTAQAQQTDRIIAWLDEVDPNSEPIAEQLAGFKQGLAEQGYVVGRNVNFEFHNAGADAERIRARAADLVRRQVAVIVTNTGGLTHAAKAAAQSIPIVFTMGGDPVEEGLVTSLNRPGGNLTGVAIQAAEVAAKRLELLHELVPKAQSIAAVTSLGAGGSDFSRAQARGFQAAALAHGVHLLSFNVAPDGDIAGAVANAVQQGAGALILGANRPLAAVADQIISLANNRYSLPTMFFRSSLAAAGGLASYGIDASDVSRQVGLYTGRILKGEKPADLPVRTPTKFVLAINLKTAKAIGLNVSQDMLSIADEVIE